MANPSGPVCALCGVDDRARPAIGAYAAGGRVPAIDRLAVLLRQAERLGYDPRRVVRAVTAPDPTRALRDEARRVAVAGRLESLAASVRLGRRWTALVAELGRIERSLLDDGREVAA